MPIPAAASPKTEQTAKTAPQPLQARSNVVDPLGVVYVAWAVPSKVISTFTLAAFEIVMLAAGLRARALAATKVGDLGAQVAIADVALGDAGDAEAALAEAPRHDLVVGARERLAARGRARERALPVHRAIDAGRADLGVRGPVDDRAVHLQVVADEVQASACPGAVAYVATTVPEILKMPFGPVQS